MGLPPSSCCRGTRWERMDTRVATQEGVDKCRHKCRVDCCGADVGGGPRHCTVHASVRQGEALLALKEWLASLPLPLPLLLSLPLLLLPSHPLP